MKILFITSSRIGDAVLTTGVLNYLTNLIPDVKLAIAAGPVAMPLFEDWPHVMWRHTFVRKGALNHWLDLWKKAWPIVWDWVIDLRGSAFSWSVRAKRRSVWKTPPQIMHRVNAIAHRVGLDPAPAPYLHISDMRQGQADILIQDPFLVLAPAANWQGKEWPLKNYSALLKKLFKGPVKRWRVLVLAAPDEYVRLRPLTESLSDQLLLPPNPNRSLLDSAALMKRARLFIGNDSGLMHMSAALGVPTIGLFGPSPSVLYDPFGPHGRAVRTPESYTELMRQKKLTPDACFMTTLSVETVYQAVYEHAHKLGCFPCVA